MDKSSKTCVRQGLYAFFGAWLLIAGLGCNTFTGLDSLQFVPCSANFDEIIATARVGSNGGSEYADLCSDGQVLVGLRGGVNGPVLSGISGICGVVTVSETFPYTLEITPDEPMPSIHGETTTEEVESRICPEDSLVVGFEGRTFPYDNQGVVAPIMLRVTLHCAPLMIDGPANTPSIWLDSNMTMTDSLGGAEDQGDAFDPIFCPEDQVARGIQGRSGLLVDAFGLGCADAWLDCPGSLDSSKE